jgi:hypothetical protein
MTSTATANATVRELDHRTTDGIEVRLLWDQRDHSVIVAVADARTGESFSVEVQEDQRAMDVFHHPYAYAASDRISHTS